jgi:hypothetical protein
MKNVLIIKDNEIFPKTMAQLAHNLIKNGNMASTDYWSKASATPYTNDLSASGNVLTSAIGTMPYNLIQIRNPGIKYLIKEGDKIYSTFKYKVTSGTNTSPTLEIGFYSAGLPVKIYVSGAFSNYDNWVTVSQIDESGVTQYEFYFLINYLDADLGTPTTVTVQLKQCGIVNLTRIYGAGNEPDLAECQSIYDDVWLEDRQDKDMYDKVKEFILSDYANGIMSANQKELACLDVYDINGNRVYDFSKGDIIKVGDVVRIDRDNDGNSISYKQNGEPRYWRVVGRQVSKVGVPKIALSLREII